MTAPELTAKELKAAETRAKLVAQLEQIAPAAADFAEYAQGVLAYSKDPHALPKVLDLLLRSGQDRHDALASSSRLYLAADEAAALGDMK